MRRFTNLKKIGKGSYGTVYKGIDIVDNHAIVAIKKIPIKSGNEGIPGSTLREVSILKVLGHHENCVSLKAVFHVETSLYLVFEYLGNDLRQLIDENERLPPRLIQDYVGQLLQGLFWIHSHGIIHRDLKPSNILVDTYGETLKICDFGLARSIGIESQSCTPEVVTLWYRAPEVLISAGSYSYPIDMWSWGCIFAELFTGTALFQAENETEQLQEIFRILGTPLRHYWTNEKALETQSWPHWEKQDMATKLPGVNLQARDLIQSVIQYDATKRPTTQAALAHSYFLLVFKTD
jgi:serine/threonine protein kinase